MKIILEPEPADLKQFPEKRVIENVFEFAITGRFLKQRLYVDTFSHLHIQDKFILEGRLHELLSRLRAISA